MKAKTTKTTKTSPKKARTKQAKGYTETTAKAAAKKLSEYADQYRRSAQARLDGIEALVFEEKERAAIGFMHAAKHDELARALLTHAELIAGKTES